MFYVGYLSAVRLCFALLGRVGRRKRSKNAITTAGDAIAQGKIPNIEAEAWKSFVESLMCDDNEDTRTLLARNMSVNENVRKEAYGFANRAGRNTLSLSEFDNDITGLYTFYPGEGEWSLLATVRGKHGTIFPETTQSAKGWRLRGRVVSEMSRRTRGGAVTGI